jgi:hypothetical protein
MRRDFFFKNKKLLDPTDRPAPTPSLSRFLRVRWSRIHYFCRLKISAHSTKKARLNGSIRRIWPVSPSLLILYLEILSIRNIIFRNGRSIYYSNILFIFFCSVFVCIYLASTLILPSNFPLWLFCKFGLILGFSFSYYCLRYQIYDFIFLMPCLLKSCVNSINFV